MACRQSLPARKVIALPAPTQPPPATTLEAVAGLLLARAAPFDRLGQAHTLAAWDLPVPNSSPYLAPLQPKGLLVRRLIGIHRQLERVTAGCPAPAVLSAALAVVTERTALTEAELRAALLREGLSKGHAGAPLLARLAALWHLPLPTALEPAPDRVAALARQVRTRGAIVELPVPAALARPLRAAGVRTYKGWLVATADRTSLLARPVRRQLAAVGPLPIDDLLVGAVRQRPALAGLTATGLLVWAGAQSDLVVEGTQVTLTTGADAWLREADPHVRALFGTGTAAVPRSAIIDVVVASGAQRPSAEVWLVRCAWLRHAGIRGRYVMAGHSPA